MYDAIIIALNLCRRFIYRKISDSQFKVFADVRRELLGERLFNQTNGRITHGKFKGLRIEKLLWGKRDLAAYILGKYEENVIEHIHNLPAKINSFVDIGAADGIYAVGFLYNGRYSSAICFESSQKSQDVIIMNAKANGVSDKVIILGLAGTDFVEKLKKIRTFSTKTACFLIDIEGGEFELLTLNNLSQLSHSYLVIELHKNVINYEEKLKILVSNASQYFRVGFISTTRKASDTEHEIAEWPDEDRCIILSEGRPYSMQWLTLSPL